MSYKTTGKAKAKPLYATPGAFTKKLGGLQPKASLAGLKGKPLYGTHKPLGSKIHDTGYGVKYVEFAKIGSEDSPVEKEAELADGLVTEVADTSADVNTLCETYQLSREELGRLTGFSLRALAQWASGNLPSRPAKRRLHEVRRLLDALAQIVKLESIPKWLHQPNPAFAPLTPLQVIELGEIDRLWAMVYDLGSGQPS
jgi:DNA-binding transcriptional regulator YiaG